MSKTTDAQMIEDFFPFPSMADTDDARGIARRFAVAIDHDERGTTYTFPDGSRLVTAWGVLEAQ